MIYLLTAICVLCLIGCAFFALACLGMYRRCRETHQAMAIVLGAELLEKLADTTPEHDPRRN